MMLQHTCGCGKQQSCLYTHSSASAAHNLRLRYDKNKTKWRHQTSILMSLRKGFNTKLRLGLLVGDVGGQETLHEHC